MIWSYILIFIVSCVLLYFSGEWLVEGLMKLTKFLGWKEFVMAFFVMAFAASLPNFIVGITSALKGIPELSFGDVAGNNLVALTLAIGLVSLFVRKGIPARSQAIQTTSLFVLTAAILPLFLIWDGKLSRLEGVILIAFFIFYCYWLFCKKERFCKIYKESEKRAKCSLKEIFISFWKVFWGVIILTIAAQGIVASAQFFAHTFNFPLLLIGILITGAGSALPEIYFAISTARKGQGWMILGDLMGAVIVPSTLVLGVVALIHPIEITDFSYFAVARIFLLIAAVFFFLFIRSGQYISRKEAAFLTLIYIVFLIIEILIK